MAIKEDETCLVVTDWRLYDIGRIFADVALEMCTEPHLLMMRERNSHGEEPPRLVADAMLDADVVLIPTYRSLSHTRARKEACNHGARVASMPQITEDILSRVSKADFSVLERDCAAWADILTRTSNVRVITDRGTDITFSIEGRDGTPDNGIYTDKGAFGNIPAGESFIAPVEGSAEGTIVVDGSMAGPGMLDEPITIRMEGGYATDITGGAGARTLIDKMAPHGKNARNLAEFAIGTNAAARLTGNVLEDEKIKGTIHLALGDNSTFGGKVSSSSHLDGIILEPTVSFDGKILIKNGKWNI